MVPEKEQPAAREDVIRLERGNFFWNSEELKDSLLGETYGPNPGNMSIIGVYASKKFRQPTGDTSPGSRRISPPGRRVTFTPMISGRKGYGTSLHPKDEHSAPLLRVVTSQEAVPKIKGSDGTGRNRNYEAFKFSEATPHHERFFLSNIDLKIPKNSFTVIVGLKNSGKTSLLYALLGEMSMGNYHTHKVSQTNRLDCDCCEIKCHCASLYGPKLRILDDMCLVTRRPYVLPFSILKNIILDQPLDSDKLKWALKVSQLEDDLILFPEGLETIITPQNKKLTIGQKIRLSLARNLYKDCEIYCFDSFLEKNFDENATKSFLEKTLLQDLGDKTRILITSDCGHAKYADKVLVMKAGKISAFDTYEKIKGHADFLEVRKDFESENKYSMSDRKEYEAMVRKNKKSMKKNQAKKRNLGNSAVSPKYDKDNSDLLKATQISDTEMKKTIYNAEIVQQVSSRRKLPKTALANKLSSLGGPSPSPSVLQSVTEIDRYTSKWTAMQELGGFW